AIILLILGLLIGAGVAVYIARLIVTPLRSVSIALRAVADGDLTVPPDVTSRDEVGLIAADLGLAIASLRQTVGMLADTSDTFAGASEELLATSGQLAGTASSASEHA